MAEPGGGPRPARRAPAQSRTLTFRPRHRLGHAREFDAVYAARVQRMRGPLSVLALPNQLPEPRLGLSVNRRVGTAVRRNTIKRRLREAFRLGRAGLPRHDRGRGGAYDYIVAVRPHEPLPMAEYGAILADLAAALHREWERRK